MYEKRKGKIAKQTPENVRISEEAAARCKKKVIKERVLEKQARKARAEHTTEDWVDLK